MSTTSVVVEGTLRSDGTLELAGKPNLPPGRVRVTVETIEPAAPPGDVWDYLERVRADNLARGFRGRSKEEIDAEINAMRDEWDEPRSETAPPRSEPRAPGDPSPC